MWGRPTFKLPREKPPDPEGSRIFHGPDGIELGIVPEVLLPVESLLAGNRVLLHDVDAHVARARDEDCARTGLDKLHSGFVEPPQCAFGPAQ